MFQSRMEIHPDQTNASRTTTEDARSTRKRRLYHKTKSLPKVTADTATPAKFAFHATCSGVPQDIYVGQRLQFQVSIQPETPPSSSPSSSPPPLPEISLDFCILTLIAQTSGPIPSHIEVLRQKQNSFHPSGPFAFPSTAEGEAVSSSSSSSVSKTVDLGILGYVPSAYHFGDVSRSYKMKLDLQFHAAGRTVLMERELPVQVWANPSLVGWSKGSSRQGSVDWEEGERVGAMERARLPSYDEVMAGDGW